MNLPLVPFKNLSLRSFKVLWALLFVLCGSAPVAQAQQTIFEDNFNSINTNVWDVHDSSWFIQRTRFGKMPSILTESGTTFARFGLDTYNPAYPGIQTLGTELWSKQSFRMGSGVEFEARVRGTNIPRGAVYAFFTYKQRDFGSDDDQEEIDFEFIGNFINSPPDAEKVWLNIWNGRVDDRPNQPGVLGLRQTEWNTFTMRWTNAKVEWLVNNVVVRTETEVMPDDFMNLCFNIWAPDSSWNTSFDASLQPTANPANNQNYYFDVDYVRVRTIPLPQNSGVIGNGTGLTGIYYDNADFTNQKTARLSPRVNHNWGSFAPAPGMGNDQWSVRWLGQIQPQFSQNYTFYTYTDDGVRLWVNDQLVIDRFIGQAATEHSGTIRLNAGQLYNIRIDYFDDAFGALAQLRWSSASTPKQLVPQSQLYALPTDTPTFSPNGGSFPAPQNVTISSAMADAEIRYTLDGSEPTQSSAVVANGGQVTVGVSSTLKAKAFRNAYSPSATQSAAFTITPDQIAPSVGITAPINTYSYTQVATVTGTASDTGGSNLQNVTARFGRYVDNAYWNGSAWTSTPVDLPVNGTSNWTWNLPALSDGKYFVRAIARDNAGNTGVSDLVDFYIDTTAPTMTISTPVAGAVYRSLTQASGTATDDGPGIAEIRVRLLRYADNTYWNNTAWTTAIVDVAAGGTNNWAWTLPPLVDGAYGFQTIARDFVGNVRISDVVNFSIDATAPTLAISQPANNSVLTAVPVIAGTAGDAASGVREVLWQLQRSDASFWNGSAWTPAAINFPASGTDNWTLGLPALEDGTYNVRVFARDGAGNDSVVATTTFSIDRTAPAVTVVSPANNSTLPAWKAISGNVVDNLVGAQRVDLYLRRLLDGAYWNGSSWVGGVAALSTTIQGNVWSYGGSLPPAVTGTYDVKALAFDGIGNSATSSTNMFKIILPPPPDRTNPVITIASMPDPYLSYLTRLSALFGLARDTGSGIARVEVVLQRDSDKLFWSGRAWGRTSVRLPARYLGPRWEFSAVPTGANLRDDIYTLVAIAIDKNGNRGSMQSRAVVDANAPQAQWTSPSNSAVLSSWPTLSGRATDSFSDVQNVELLIQRRSDRKFWNGGSWQVASIPLATTRSRIAKSVTWTRNTLLPNGANLIDGDYVLVATAYDILKNRSSAVITITIRKPPATTGPATRTTEAASSVTLSTGAVDAANSSVALTWTGALDSNSANDATLYEVQINGVVVPLESTSYQASTRRVLLGLPENQLRSGDVVTVRWNNLLDTKGATVASKTATLRVP